MVEAWGIRGVGELMGSEGKGGSTMEREIPYLSITKRGGGNCRGRHWITRGRGLLLTIVANKRDYSCENLKAEGL